MTLREYSNTIVKTIRCKVNKERNAFIIFFDALMMFLIEFIS